MGKILEAFFNGNLQLQPAIYNGSKEYQKARSRFCKLAEDFITELNTKEQETFEKILDAQAGENELYTTDRFVTGYRLGVLMTMEVFSGGTDLILGEEE